jgi:hypothetical protein
VPVPAAANMAVATLRAATVNSAGIMAVAMLPTARVRAAEPTDNIRDEADLSRRLEIVLGWTL